MSAGLSNQDRARLAVLPDPAADRSTIEECTRHCRHGVAVKRDQWERPLVAGKAWTRVSTLSNALDDGYNLGMWKARRAVAGICEPKAAHLRERVLTSRADDEDDAILREVTDEALVLGGAKVAATRGSSLHDVIGLLNRGLPMPAGLHENTVASAEAYMRRLDALGLVPVLSEQFGVCPLWECAGTADGTFLDRDGVYRIGDVKTGAKSWEQAYPLSVAQQLCAYAYAERWCPIHSFLPTPEHAHDYALLISVPVDTGTASVHRIDIGKGFALLDTAVAVRAERSRQRTLNLGELT